MSRRLIALLAALSAALLLLGPTGVAAAATVKVSSNITIHYKSSAFGGHVSSSRSSCVKGRTVKLYRDRKGPDFVVGTTLTNSNGHWKVPDPGAKGRFYAQAARRQMQKGNDTIVCKAATSPTIKV